MILCYCHGGWIIWHSHKERHRSLNEVFPRKMLESTRKIYASSRSYVFPPGILMLLSHKTCESTRCEKLSFKLSSIFFLLLLFFFKPFTFPCEIYRGVRRANLIRKVSRSKAGTNTALFYFFSFLVIFNEARLLLFKTRLAVFSSFAAYFHPRRNEQSSRVEVDHCCTRWDWKRDFIEFHLLLK